MIALPEIRKRAEWEERWTFAETPSRELDLEIAKAFGKATEDYRVSRHSVTGIISGDGVGGYGNPFVERYSEDVSAMIRLVEEMRPEAMWLTNKRPGGYRATLYPFVDGEAQLPAVALAIALRLDLERVS